MSDTNTTAAPAEASTSEQPTDTQSTAAYTIDTDSASDADLAEVADSDDATSTEKAEAKVELKRRMKFKVNGRDVERDIDLSDEAGLQELLQKGFAADERFQSASGLEKKMNEFAKLMQSDPMQALIAAGHDPDKLTEAYMQKRVAELSKSPEQQQIEKLQKDLDKERKSRETMENEKLTAEQSKVEAEYANQLDNEISGALSASDLPKSPYVVKRIAEHLMLEIDGGNEDVTVQDVLPYVEKQIKDEIRQMFESMPEDIIEKTLGNDVSSKLRKRRLNSMKKAPDGASSVKATGQSEINKTKTKEEAKPMSAKDFFKNW